MKNEVSKKLSVVFLVLAIGMVVFFTFQDRVASFELTEKIRIWLSDHNVELRYETLRTNAHLVEYFILGLALAIYAKSKNFKFWIPMVVGCGIGVLDESIKILLPGREFGNGDLVRDIIGVGAAIVFVKVWNSVFRREKSL